MNNTPTVHRFTPAYQDHPALKKGLWSPPSLISNPLVRWLVLIGVGFFLWAGFESITFDPERIARGAERAQQFFAGFFRPDFVSRWDLLLEGIGESLAMTLVSTALGVLVSVPIALGAAKNVSPLWVYGICRGIIIVSRSFQEVIIAIFVVAAIGFGPLAGVITLAFGTVGFLGKLIAEAIEEVDPAQVEAIKATGAPWIVRMVYSIQPQVFPRFLGLILYRLDINFRESAVIGIVGAGGIGAMLNTALRRYDYDIAGAVLIVIIVIVMIAEYSTGIIRKGFR